MRTLFMMTLAALTAAAPALAEPQRFATPEAAVEAVVTALRARDRAGVLAVFGPEAEDVLLTGEDAADREAWTSFVEAHDELSRVAEQTDGTATLYVGRNQWPFPVPLAKGEDGTWAFDADAAREEIFHRRIGRNELDVIALLRAYVATQGLYRLTDYDGDGVMSFAGKIASTPGGRDGLYWAAGEGVPPSLVGNLAAGADAARPDPEPFHGYLFRILHAQGPAAPGGALDYMVNGRMLAGHAVIAFPYAYAETGIMSFMVSENGAIWEADLGEETAAAAAAIQAFDPAPPWTPLEEE